MSTNDVPGAKASNRDVLAAGCWSEHEDGTLIFVKGTEDRVVYEIYDMADDPPTTYTDAMAEEEFKKFFSWDPKGEGLKWTWHDKTPFPWERIIKVSPRPKPSYASADAHASAAQKVVNSLRRRGHNIAERKARREEMGHMVEQEGSRGMLVLEKIATALERAFTE